MLIFVALKVFALRLPQSMFVSRQKASITSSRQKIYIYIYISCRSWQWQSLQKLGQAQSFGCHMPIMSPGDLTPVQTQITTQTTQINTSQRVLVRTPGRTTCAVSIYGQIWRE